MRAEMVMPDDADRVAVVEDGRVTELGSHVTDTEAAELAQEIVATMEGIAILARESDIDRGTAARVWERTHLDIDPVPGDDQLEVLERIAPILVETGDVPDLETVQKAIDTILDARFAQEASAQRAAEIIEGHSA